jgi:tripartite-type tricarboxylate transporter receptor subunit TctC
MRLFKARLTCSVVVACLAAWVPAGTPPAVAQRLHALVVKAFEEPEIRELWFKLGADPGGMPPDGFATFVRGEVQKWGKVVREAGITIE